MTEPTADDRAPDWLDRLYEDETEPDEPGEQHTPRWWSLRKSNGAPADPEPETDQPAPGVHVTINQPAPAATNGRAHERRSRNRRWLLFHGAAAGAGWYCGLGPAMAELLEHSGHAAPAVGIGLIFLTGLPASYLPGLPFIPPPLRPVTVWLSRIPASTAALALALNTPGALI